MSRQAQLSDGTILEFPDGTKDEVMNRVVKQHVQAQAVQAKAEQEKVNPTRSFKDYVTMGGNALARGVSRTGETLAHAIPMGLGENNLPARALRVGTDYLLDKFGGPKPVTAKEKIAAAMAEGVGSSIVPGGAAGAIIPQVTSGALAGAAGEGAKQMGFGPKAQVAAALLAGTAPAAIGSTIKNAGGAITAFTRNPAERAARRLQDAATDTRAARRAIAARRTPLLGVQHTTAEVAEDPGLAALQRNRHSTAVEAQQDRNAQLRTGIAENELGPGDTGAIPALGRRVAAENVAATEEATGRIGPIAERSDTGGQTRGAFKEAYDEAKTRTEAAYNVPELTTEHPIEIEEGFKDALRSKLHDFYGNANGEAAAPIRSIITDLMDNAGEGSGLHVNTRIVANIDRRLSDFAGKAKISGAPKEGAFAQSLRDILEKHVAHQMPDEVKAALTNAKALRAEQGVRFEQGRAARAFRTGRFKEPGVPDVELPGALTGRGAGGGETAEGLIAAIGPKASEATVRQEMRRLVDEGKLDTPQKVTAFSELLKRFPGLRGDVQALRERAALNEQFSGSQLGRISDPAVAPSQHISSLLSKNDNGISFKGLVDQVRASGDHDAMAGLRRALAEHIKEAGGTAKLDVTGQPIPHNDKTLAAINRVLEHGGDVLTDSQKQVLGSIKRDMEQVNYARNTGVHVGEAPFDPTVPFVKGMTARTLNYFKKKFSNEGGVEKLIEKALLDPELAADLLKRPTPDRLAKWGRTMRAATTGAYLGAQQFQ